jgi:hypothetical protein
MIQSCIIAMYNDHLLETLVKICPSQRLNEGVSVFGKTAILKSTRTHGDLPGNSYSPQQEMPVPSPGLCDGALPVTGQRIAGLRHGPRQHSSPGASEPARSTAPKQTLVQMFVQITLTDVHNISAHQAKVVMSLFKTGQMTIACKLRPRLSSMPTRKTHN